MPEDGEFQPDDEGFGDDFDNDVGLDVPVPQQGDGSSATSDDFRDEDLGAQEPLSYDGGFGGFGAAAAQDDSAYSTVATARGGQSQTFAEPFGDAQPNLVFGASQDDDPWSKHAMVGSRDRWEQKTVESLNHAKALTKHALKSLLDSEVMHGNSHRQMHANTSAVNHTIKKKIGFTEDLIKAIEDRIESVEDTMRQVGECLFQLQRAQRSKWAPLNVCERRLELRDGRPLQELIRDSCQQALENERQTLIESRQELTDQVDSMKEMLVTLDKLKTELTEDLQHKRHALRIDRSCLSPKKPVSGKPGSQAHDRLILPQLQEVVHYGQPPAPKNALSGTGGDHEETRQVNTREIISKAVKCEEDAMRLSNESDAVMIHTKRECTRASQVAQAELAKRVDETHTLRKQLDSQIQDTDEAIAQTEMSLSKTRKKLDSHDQPLRALDKQFSMRGKRTSREGIRDHVHDEMEGHLDQLKKSVGQLTDKWKATKDILDQLRSARQQMSEDIKCKLQAQKIDDSCLKVTPKKAIELDRLDPRGGRCREPVSARRKGGNGGQNFEANYTPQTVGLGF